MAERSLEPHQPQTMNDVLRYSIGMGQGQPTHDPIEPMSEERREFLNKALESMTSDHIKAIKAHLSILKESSSTTEDNEEAIERLVDLCENLDFAQDFHKVGGYDILSKHFCNESDSVRTMTYDLVAALVQNNDYCQEKALDAGWLKVLISAVDQDVSMDVRVKALYALSCLLGNYKAAQTAFSKLDGFSVLVRAMQTGSEKMQIKSVFLMKKIITSQPMFKDVLCDIGMIDQLVACLSGDHSVSHEHFMFLLLTLVTDFPKAAGICRQNQYHLSSFLSKRVTELARFPEFSDEMEYASEILRICFPSDQNIER